MLYDLIIIGGGPAGITAGIFGARKKLNALLITKDFLGQVNRTSRIDNYPGFFGISGPKMIKIFEEHLKNFEIQIKEQESVIKIEKRENNFLVKTDKENEYLTKTVIVATGRNPRPLKVPGEKEFIGKGVSYCSLCDAPFFQGKKVAVIGGGNSGFETALDLAKYAKEIFIFESSNRILADEIIQEKIKKEKKIKIYLNKEIKSIEGENKVESLIYQDLKGKEIIQIPIDGIFIQIGSIPATGFLEGLVKFNEKDEVVVDFETYATSCPGLFAAGDVNSGRWKQIVIAAAEGSRAALTAYEYLQNLSLNK